MGMNKKIKESLVFLRNSLVNNDYKECKTYEF